MPTVISHPAVAIGAFPWFRRRLGHPALLLVGMALTALPDIDVIGFRFGIAYGDLLGHRGLTHSLFFALAVGGLVAWPASHLTGASLRVLWFYFFLCLGSHGLLDALTDGGRGIAFLSPFSNERYFFDVRPIRASALSLERFFAGDWTGLLAVEMRWIWLPPRCWAPPASPRGGCACPSEPRQRPPRLRSKANGSRASAGRT